MIRIMIKIQIFYNYTTLCCVILYRISLNQSDPAFAEGRLILIYLFERAGQKLRRTQIKISRTKINRCTN